MIRWLCFLMSNGNEFKLFIADNTWHHIRVGLIFFAIPLILGFCINILLWLTLYGSIIISGFRRKLQSFKLIIRLGHSLLSGIHFEFIYVRNSAFGISHLEHFPNPKEPYMLSANLFKYCFSFLPESRNPALISCV